MKNSLWNRMENGLKPKAEVQTSSVDDKSMVWKVPLIILPFMALLLIPGDLETVLQIISFIVGIFMIYISTQKIFQFKLSGSWKTVEGELLYSKVAIDNPYARDLLKSYFPYMKYSYTVGRKTYFSDKVANYRELRDYPEEIEEMITQMTTPKLTVYYNPKNPEKSLLIADMPLHRKLFWIFMLLMGVGAFWAGLM